jgi:hypothetical protein
MGKKAYVPGEYRKGIGSPHSGQGTGWFELFLWFDGFYKHEAIGRPCIHPVMETGSSQEMHNCPATHCLNIKFTGW